MADSRPEPGPCTRTCTRLTPRFSASRAACSAATVAANGVDFFDPLKPAFPDEPHVIVLPCMSVIVMSVLLNVAVMCATASASTTFLARLAPAFAVAIYFLRTAFFLPGIARRGPFLVRALVCVRWPCRCLCLGLRLQITRITPRRLTTLQCSQIGRTLERTFNGASPRKKSNSACEYTQARKSTQGARLRLAPQLCQHPAPQQQPEPQEHRFPSLVASPRHHIDRKSVV